MNFKNQLKSSSGNKLRPISNSVVLGSREDEHSVELLDNLISFQLFYPDV